jgi:hypothetical protein
VPTHHPHAHVTSKVVCDFILIKQLHHVSDAQQLEAPCWVNECQQNSEPQKQKCEYPSCVDTRTHTHTHTRPRTIIIHNVSTAGEKRDKTAQQNSTIKDKLRIPREGAIAVIQTIRDGRPAICRVRELNWHSDTLTGNQ